MSVRAHCAFLVYGPAASCYSEAEKLLYVSLVCLARLDVLFWNAVSVSQEETLAVHLQKVYGNTFGSVQLLEMEQPTRNMRTFV